MLLPPLALTDLAKDLLRPLASGLREIKAALPFPKAR
jgi:hypothetical protein